MSEHRNGYKKTQIGWFPEHWEIKDLNSLGHFIKGSGIPREKIKSFGIPAITYGEIYTTYSDVINNFKSYIDSSEKNNGLRIPKNSILFAGSGETHEEIGKNVAFVSDIEAYAGGDIIVLKTEIGNPIYISFLLNSSIGVKQKSRLGQGFSIVHIYSRDLKNIQIPIPPIKEQNKIAEILLAYNNLINLNNKLIKAKQKLKKALMQQLLTGKMRFPEYIKSDLKKIVLIGRIPDDWQFVPISSVAIQINNRNESKEDIPVLSCTKYDGLVESQKYFGKRIYSEDTSNYKVVKKGQFAYATNHIEEGSIGFQYQYEKGLISPMYTVFQTTNKVNGGFLYKLLRTETYRRIFEINTNSTVNRRGSLRWPSFSKIKIPLPPMKEQIKINSIMDKCQLEIDLLKRQKFMLEKQKSGLMQQLFTGEIRVMII